MIGGIPLIAKNAMSGAPDGLDGAVFLVLFFVGVFFVFFFFVLKTHRFLFIPSLVSQDGVGYGVAVDDDFLGAGLMLLLDLGLLITVTLSTPTGDFVHDSVVGECRML